MTFHTISFLALLIRGSPSLALGDDEKPPEALSSEELLRRRDALDAWTFEPVALEGHAFRLHLDRKDGSFFFQDRRTGVKWFSSWGRRGFASLLLKKEGGGEGKADRWIPLDRVEGLHSEETKIHFRAGSAEGPSPAVQFELETIGTGLSLRFEVPEEARARVAAVRLLESSLWIPEVDRGGVALPRGMGEWRAVEAGESFHVKLDGVQALSGIGGEGERSSAEPFTLLFLGLVKSDNPILLRWLDPAAHVDVEQRAVPGDSFPGLAGVFTSIEFKAPTGKIELYALGKEEIGPVDAAKAYRQTLGSSLLQSTLRAKTGMRPELRAFMGSALFRPVAGAPLSFKDIAAYAEHLKRDLEIDEAAFVLSGWSKTAAGSSQALLPANPEAGGNDGLKDLARRLKELQFIFGLEAKVDAFAPSSAADIVAFWREALEAGKREENFPALLDFCSPQLILLEEATRPGPRGARPEDLLQARADLGRYLRDTFGLAGMSPGSEAEIEYCAYFEGFLGKFVQSPLSSEAWPLFPAALGHCVRLSGDPGRPLKPDDPAGLLAHLLLGEVPIYEMPPVPPVAAKDDPRWCFARDEGWAKGKGLSPQDIFLKNTYEVLSHVARQRYREPLLYHQALSPGGGVRETFFGMDMRIVVNFSSRNYEDKEDGFLLPPFGFVVRHPFLYAFHALRVNDVEYERPAFFVVRSLEGKMYLRAEQVKIYHGFGPDTIHLGGKTFTVPREAIVRIW